MSDQELDSAIAKRVGRDSREAAPHFCVDDNAAREMREWIRDQGSEAINSFSDELLPRIPDQEMRLEREDLRAYVRTFHILNLHPRIQAEAFYRAFCTSPEPPS